MTACARSHPKWATGWKCLVPPQMQPLAVAVPNSVTTLVGALTALGNQAGSSATVRVDPINRRIEVIHHV